MGSRVKACRALKSGARVFWISGHRQPGGCRDRPSWPAFAPPLSLAPERFSAPVWSTRGALLLRRGRTQTRPAFQRFEAVAVLLLERFRGGFAFSAGLGPVSPARARPVRSATDPASNKGGPISGLGVGRRRGAQPQPLFPASRQAKVRSGASRGAWMAS